MRLNKIKLAGFKSFVDPTTILLKSNLVAVVGPNGCGKSNIIDAVRWVMGESSAKHLRGESMADVIFNGSSARKPVGQASVELHFDNSEGRLGGPYEGYGEIAVKRQVSRDGQSSYFLNGARCRRRDITDIFLGTGLGPRSYAVIEQGTISRLIEARPEELRLFLEEAAGISRYKERRRETEIRLRHTRENIDRVNDIRDELSRQLDHLREQAQVAARYRSLKDQELLTRLQWQALRWRALDRQAREEAMRLRAEETAIEGGIAAVRAHEAELEGLRGQQDRATAAFNEVQGEFYRLGAEMARLEESLKSAETRRQQLAADLSAVQGDSEQGQLRLQRDEQQRDSLHSRLEAAREEQASLSVLAEEARSALLGAEAAMHEWQRKWEDWTRRAAGPQQAREVELAKLEQLRRQSELGEQRLERLDEEERQLVALHGESSLAEAQEGAEHAQRHLDVTEQALRECDDTLRELRAANVRRGEEVDVLRGSLHHLRGRLASLLALQQEAMGSRREALVHWVEQHGLSDAPRLAERLQVEEGWEWAAECALGEHLQAICVDRSESFAGVLGSLESGTLGLFETGADRAFAPLPRGAAVLLDRIDCPWPLDALLTGVYAAEDLAEALARRPQLAAHESVITRSGIWMGPSWLRVARASDATAGVLARAREIRDLQGEEAAMAASLAEQEAALAAGRRLRQELEGRRADLAGSLRQAQQRLTEATARLHGEQARREQVQSRLERLRHEAADLREQMTDLQGETERARGRLDEAAAQARTLESEGQRLAERRTALGKELEEAKARAVERQEAVHGVALQAQSLATGVEGMVEAMARLEEQLKRQEAQREELTRALAESAGPLQELQESLQRCLARRGEMEGALRVAREETERLAERLAETDRARMSAEQEVRRLKDAHEEGRMRWQEAAVLARSLEQELEGSALEWRAVLQELPEEAQVEDRKAKLDRIAARIERLGAVNLAAIEEFDLQSQRKAYLDAQLADLQQAVHTLESAIRTIDRETRDRFGETFQQVNEGLQSLFPRLFGGGHAYLELTGEELLDAGVSVLVRPPGKRISHIHLLSGGEKALTAVALVFALFELNPAPFCLLDEVDAPLDDANVNRFCHMVSDMSERTQFIFVTHNKVTMELAAQLTGVTMHEAGVSRLVAVDVEEAVAMAGAQG